MRAFVGLLLIVGVAGGAWFFFQNYEIEGLEAIRVVPNANAGRLSNPLAGRTVPVSRNGETIRIATFNIQVFGSSKADKTHVMDILSRVARQFDVIAIQEIRARDQDIIPRYVERINMTGRQFDYVIGPRLGRTDSKEQYAFVFDRASIEVDRSQLYTIDDPDDLMHREPLVGWFRVRGPSQDQAFTFTLINVHTDPDETDQELDVLDDIFRVVQNDGRGEDDVILLGDLNVNDRHLGQLGQVENLTWVVSGTPTNTRGTKQYDNILFSEAATVEFTGRGGVYDFMREHNLSLQEAIEVSDHLPVWAEFSIHEGGKVGQLAARPTPAPAAQ